MKRPDRFDKMAETAQAELDSYDLRQSIDGRRRVIAAALRTTHSLGLEEAKRGWEQLELKEATVLISMLRAQIHRLTHGEEIESDRICDHELDARAALDSHRFAALMAYGVSGGPGAWRWASDPEGTILDTASAWERMLAEMREHCRHAAEPAPAERRPVALLVGGHMSRTEAATWIAYAREALDPDGSDLYNLGRDLGEALVVRGPVAMARHARSMRRLDPKYAQLCDFARCCALAVK